MNQFKPIFLGTVGKTDDMAQLKRATDSQKVYNPSAAGRMGGRLTSRSVYVRAESITISTMLARTAITTPSSKC